MAVPVGILACLVLVSMGLTTYAIASNTPLESGNNAMDNNESEIQSRNDYPDMDELSSFFDFEIGPPQITFKHLEDKPKKIYSSRPHLSKNYYYYNSEGYPKYKLHQYHDVPTTKQVVTPGAHYKSSTEKTFIEGEKPINESDGILNQAKVGQYQVSIVDADSPLLSNLGLTQGDLEKLATYNKHSTTNATMLASDSTATGTYAENPRVNYPQSGYPPSHNQNAPSYPPPYDTSNYSPQRANYDDRNYRPSDRHSSPEAQNSQGGYSHGSTSVHPPPQGSYDPKSYRSVQGSSPQGTNGYNYPSSPYHHHPPPSYNNPPQPSTSYNNPPQSSASYASPHQLHNPHQPSTNYNNPHPASYSNPPHPTSYSPQRSSGEPWRQSSHVHTDWDDKQNKPQDTWQGGPYPPHPPPLPYSSTSSNTGTYNSKPTYGYTSDKSGHRITTSYSKPESSPKATYSGSTSSSADHSSHKPYYPSSSYSSPNPSSSYSSSKVPGRHGTVSYAASSHHEHPAPAKPGITIRFKAKAPTLGHDGHGGHGGHGVNIPLSFNPLDVVKKLLPSLNPLNNKKVTIGITIENKKPDHHEY